LSWLDGCWARKSAKFGEVELETDIAEVAHSGISKWHLGTSCGLGVANDLQLLFVHVELHAHAIDLGTQLAVFMIGSLGGLFQLFNLGLKVLQMFLLALPECPLGGSVLSFAFLSSTLLDL
jgi:hypothetical protein